jgi:hypothetical protein
MPKSLTATSAVRQTVRRRLAAADLRAWVRQQEAEKRAARKAAEAKDLGDLTAHLTCTDSWEGVFAQFETTEAVLAGMQAGNTFTYRTRLYRVVECLPVAGEYQPVAELRARLVGKRRTPVAKRPPLYD